jgi:hypothetical protein
MFFLFSCTKKEMNPVDSVVGKWVSFRKTGEDSFVSSDQTTTVTYYSQFINPRDRDTMILNADWTCFNKTTDFNGCWQSGTYSLSGDLLTLEIDVVCNVEMGYSSDWSTHVSQISNDTLVLKDKFAKRSSSIYMFRVKSSN